MRREIIVPTEDRRVGRAEAENTVRRVLGEADVTRVSVRDTHGHTILEVPVRPSEVGLVMEPIVAATRAVADTVGEVVLRVEKEPELPERSGTSAGGSTQASAEASAQDTGAGVTQEDIERIRDANAVPTSTWDEVRRTAPEEKGEPELKGTGE
jgi:hypothetical protein